MLVFISLPGPPINKAKLYEVQQKRKKQLIDNEDYVDESTPLKY